MERAAGLIGKNKYSKKIFTDDDLARAIWPTAVGKAIAAHTSRLRLVRNTLVVEVEDAIWQKQLYHLTASILDRLRKVTASDIVRDIEFRIAIPRREPGRAETRERLELKSVELKNTDPSDESESIRDPVLKKVYRLSRKKATA
ncbi:MAG: DUF721 domain-containing protein [Acidobacteriota bacterium]|nr:DUF721 domain-containing protein [Acidobacteriota bacterium]